MIEKKLLVVADTYYPKVDGTLRFVEEFVKRSHYDFKISLLVPKLNKKNDPLKKFVQSITLIEPSRWWGFSGYPNMKFSFKNIKRIKKAVKDTDVLFVQGPGLISYLSIYYGRKFKKKTSFYVHVIAWELFEKFFPPILNKLFFRLIKNLSIKFYNWCDEIIVPYHELMTQLKREGVKTEFSVAKLGIDINIFSPTKDKSLNKRKVNIHSNKQVVGYVGRISKEKNVGILLDAFKKLDNQDDLQLLIVGDGPENQTKEFKELKNCTITGFVNKVQNYLKAMDVFVMPSLTETTSLATLEAMSCGIPVVVSKVGFMKSYVVKNHNGIFFPKNSSTMLAMKIEKLLKDYKLREKLGEHARKTVAYSFSWERSINKIKKLLLDHFFKE